MKRHIFFIHIALLLIILTACVTAIGPVEKRALKHAMGGYEPLELQSIDDLPPEINLSVQSHLVDHLGSKFFQELTFSGGEIVDFDELYVINPGAKNYKWTVPKYRLYFSYSARDLGIKEYQAEISLDDKGMVLEDINLPNIASDPSKGTFISLSQARKTAYAERFYATDVELVYMDDMDAVAWRFKLWDREATQYLCVSAHTGEVLAKYGSVPIY